MVSVWNDKLQGGNADTKTPADFPKKQLAIGIKEEGEHTGDIHTRTEIAMDHESKDPTYYPKLKIMEKTPLSKLQSLLKCMRA
jgi:hypothetical protein